MVYSCCKCSKSLVKMNNEYTPPNHTEQNTHYSYSNESNATSGQVIGTLSDAPSDPALALPRSNSAPPTPIEQPVSMMSQAWSAPNMHAAMMYQPGYASAVPYPSFYSSPPSQYRVQTPTMPAVSSRPSRYFVVQPTNRAWPPIGMYQMSQPVPPPAQPVPPPAQPVPPPVRPQQVDPQQYVTYSVNHIRETHYEPNPSNYLPIILSAPKPPPPPPDPIIPDPNMTHVEILPPQPAPIPVEPVAPEPQVQIPAVQQVITCIRKDCSNPPVDNPDWNGEYCSSECCVIHCREAFASWVASRVAK